MSSSRQDERARNALRIALPTTEFDDILYFEQAVAVRGGKRQKRSYCWAAVTLHGLWMVNQEIVATRVSEGKHLEHVEWSDISGLEKEWSCPAWLEEEIGKRALTIKLWRTKECLWFEQKAMVEKREDREERWKGKGGSTRKKLAEAAAGAVTSMSSATLECVHVVAYKVPTLLYYHIEQAWNLASVRSASSPWGLLPVDRRRKQEMTAKRMIQRKRVSQKTMARHGDMYRAMVEEMMGSSEMDVRFSLVEELAVACKNNMVLKQMFFSDPTLYRWWMDELRVFLAPDWLARKAVEKRREQQDEQVLSRPWSAPSWPFRKELSRDEREEYSIVLLSLFANVLEGSQSIQEILTLFQEPAPWSVNDLASVLIYDCVLDPSGKDFYVPGAQIRESAEVVTISKSSHVESITSLYDEDLVQILQPRDADWRATIEKTEEQAARSDALAASFGIRQQATLLQLAKDCVRLQMKVILRVYQALEKAAWLADIRGIGPSTLMRGLAEVPGFGGRKVKEFAQFTAMSLHRVDEETLSQLYEDLYVLWLCLCKTEKIPGALEGAGPIARHLLTHIGHQQRLLAMQQQAQDDLRAVVVEWQKHDENIPPSGCPAARVIRMCVSMLEEINKVVQQ